MSGPIKKEELIDPEALEYLNEVTKAVKCLNKALSELSVDFNISKKDLIKSLPELLKSMKNNEESNHIEHPYVRIVSSKDLDGIQS